MNVLKLIVLTVILAAAYVVAKFMEGLQGEHPKAKQSFHNWKDNELPELIDN